MIAPAGAFYVQDDYDDLIYEIEQNYANYYEFKYEPKFVTLSEVQDKLAYRDALIEYVLSDSLLITYVVDRKGINVFSQEIDRVDMYKELYKLESKPFEFQPSSRIDSVTILGCHFITVGTVKMNPGVGFHGQGSAIRIEDNLFDGTGAGLFVIANNQHLC